MKNKTNLNSETKIKGKSLKKAATLDSVQQKVFYVIMLPYIIFFLITKAFPLVWGMYISLTNFNGYNLDNLKFVGLQNFRSVFADNEAFPSIMRVMGIGVITVPLGLTLCTVFALALSTSMKGTTTFRVILYLPCVIPAVAVAMMWKGIYAYNDGFFNAIRMVFDLPKINWLGYDYAKTSLIIMMLWSSLGGMLTTIAAIKAVPEDLYEAATIDGMDFIRKTFKITIPMISNMLYMQVLTSIIGAFQLFGQPVLLTGTAAEGLTSAPIRPLYTYLVHVYQQIFVNMRFGYGMAMTWVIFAIIMAVTFVLEATKKYWVYNEVD